MNPPPRDAVACPLRGRAIPPAQRDAHHLVPKSKGGRQTEFLHRVCHRQIHALLTETELARQYASVEALLAHGEMQVFVVWVESKPEDTFMRKRKSTRMRKGHRVQTGRACSQPELRMAIPAGLRGPAPVSQAVASSPGSAACIQTVVADR